MITIDLSEFGEVELNEASVLLHYYLENKEVLGNGVQLYFNTSSGNVYLMDENENIAMYNPINERIELVWKCPECGFEGFENELIENEKCCKKFVMKNR